MEKIFGPYDNHPNVHISYKDGCSLKRIIYEEEPENITIQETKEESFTNGKMTTKQLILYYFFLYTPTKKQEQKPKLKTIERKVLAEEVLCESASSFEICEEDGKYYVHARISNKK